MPLFLMLLLFVAAPAVAQESAVHVPDSPAAIPVGEAALDPVQEASVTSSADVSLRIDRRGAVDEAATGTAAQPTVQGFLYHVFLTAVTALVTALIWRAVF